METRTCLTHVFLYRFNDVKSVQKDKRAESKRKKDPKKKKIKRSTFGKHTFEATKFMWKICSFKVVILEFLGHGDTGLDMKKASSDRKQRKDRPLLAY